MSDRPASAVLAEAAEVAGYAPSVHNTQPWRRCRVRHRHASPQRGPGHRAGSPFSAVIEVPATREVLRRLLSGIGYPYLVLRLGIAPDDRPGPPHTPRVPAAQLIEIGEAP